MIKAILKKILLKIITWPPANLLIRHSLKPFSGYLTKKLKIPVRGKFRLKINKDHSVYLHTNYTSIIGHQLFWEGIKGYEYEVIRIFLPLVRNACTFLDIGANLGNYSILAAALNPDLQVIAFEPVRDALHYLKKSISSNGLNNVIPEELALCDHKGKATFHYKINPFFPKEKRQISGGHSLVAFDDHKRIQIEVPANTLDNYVEEKKLTHVDLIKVDTETTEYMVLSHGKETLERFRPLIFCEVLKGFHEKELEGLLKDLNYLFFRIEADGVNYFENLDALEGFKNDFLFIPKEKIPLMRKNFDFFM